MTQGDLLDPDPAPAPIGPRRNIRVGLCSWSDPSLIKSKAFYPRGCSSAEARLRYYASQFPIVEVDSSFYAMPSATNAVLWAERTPSDFVFNVKAFRLLTGHQTPPAVLPADIAAALPPLPARKRYGLATTRDGQTEFDPPAPARPCGAGVRRAGRRPPRGLGGSPVTDGRRKTVLTTDCHWTTPGCVLMSRYPPSPATISMSRFSTDLAECRHA